MFCSTHLQLHGHEAKREIKSCGSEMAATFDARRSAAFRYFFTCGNKSAEDVICSFY